jgi:hypothetical protein
VRRVAAALALVLAGGPGITGATGTRVGRPPADGPPDAELLLQLDLLRESDLRKERDLYSKLTLLERLRLLEQLGLLDHESEMRPAGKGGRAR